MSIKLSDIQCVPKKRSEALLLGLSTYFTGKPCKQGHINLRFSSGGQCVECNGQHLAKWRKENRDHERRYRSSYHEKKRDEICERKRRYLLENIDTERARKRADYHNNKEKRVESNRKWRSLNKARISYMSRKWRKENKDVVAAHVSARRARILKASPPWLTDEHKEEIVLKYRQAKEAKRITGIDHHVDHIVPLVGRNVCGLHVPWNLQVITAQENLRKHRRHSV